MTSETNWLILQTKTDSPKDNTLLSHMCTYISLYLRLTLRHNIFNVIIIITKFRINNSRQMQDYQKTLHVGIDAGSVSFNCIVINEHREIVYEHPYTRHLGRVEKLVIELIRDIYDKFGEKNIRSIWG